MDNANKIQRLSKTGIKQAFSLKIIFILLGLIVSIPITYTIAYNFDVQTYRLVALQLISVFIILFADFRKSKHAAMLCFLLRVFLALITGFVVFSSETILINIMLTLYTLVLLSVLSYGLSDDYQKLSILFILAFVFNLFSGFLLRINEGFAGFGPLHNILITISTIAVFACFMLLNVDNSRRFGDEHMTIPASMNRAMIAILAAVVLLMLFFTLLPWMQNAIAALIAGIAGLLGRLFSFLLANRHHENQSIPDDYGFGDLDLFPLISDEDIVLEPPDVNPVVMWLFLGFFLLILSALIIFALIKLSLFLLKLLKTKQQRAVTSNEVFTETIEKIKSTRKKRIKQNRNKRPRYSSLLTESERIKYIYYEYVQRAKRNGLTRDANSDTPNEVLDEVSRSIEAGQNIKDKNFQMPGNLGKAFNSVRYSNFIDSTNEINAQDILHLK